MYPGSNTCGFGIIGDGIRWMEGILAGDPKRIGRFGDFWNGLSPRAEQTGRVPTQNEEYDAHP